MDATQVKTKLIGYGFSLLEGIDPNPEVFSQHDYLYYPTFYWGIARVKALNFKFCQSNTLDLNLDFSYRTMYALE